MPKLSLYREQRGKDYEFFDRRISEMFTVGAATVLVHKYLGPKDQGETKDATQPQYANQSVLNIQDLLYLENRDRSYDTTVYRLRIHHSMQNVDFDLTQFGLFLNNDTLFGTVHKNDCYDTLGRLLMSGDVIELPYLREFHPLNETEIQASLRRYYVVQDTANAAEGFSPTWYPHLWRVKCEPLVDSQEFKDILNKPQDQTNYLGNWSPMPEYYQGDKITFGNKNYVATKDVPAGIAPGTEQGQEYWQLDGEQSLGEMFSTYSKNIEINNAILAQAEAEVPKSGYDVTPFYIVPTDDAGEVAVDLTPRPQDDRYRLGYLTRDGMPPNGAPVSAGVIFPEDPNDGDFCLRLDFMPNRLFRFNGRNWIKYEDAVRTDITPRQDNDTQHYGFYNNSANVATADRGDIPSRQSLSQLLRPKDDH